MKKEEQDVVSNRLVDTMQGSGKALVNAASAGSSASTKEKPAVSSLSQKNSQSNKPETRYFNRGRDIF